MKEIDYEYYVSLEVAKLLKEVGFDYKCRCYYEASGKLRGKNSESCSNYNSPLIWQNNGNTDTQLYSAPTLDVAQRWLREVKGWEAQVAYGFDENGHKTYVTECGNPKGDLENYIVYFSTYEEALEACIRRCLTLILEKNE